MSMLKRISYGLQASDICKWKSFVNRSEKDNTSSLDCSASVEVWSLTDEGHVCDFTELKSLNIYCSGYNAMSAKITLNERSDISECKYTSDWLRAVARMFNHLADNMDRLPTHEQTIATMVANRME
jgi:hypothetical protein